ncbi:MAG: hypothetical protein WCD08_04220 [Steroidobacteraceae bacterium]
MKLTLMVAAWVVSSAVWGAEPELEPAVRTSPEVAPAPSTPALKPAAAPVVAPARAPAGARPTAAPKAGSAHAQDRIELEATQITGNRELPNVMYVVPWKKPDLGDFAGRPPKSLLDELLAPVDREVFRRQNRYFAALQPDAATSTAPGTGAAPPPAVPAAPVSGDEK